MKKRKKSGSGGANWMDTYGDMVTLLLCFFVMLYSMSTMDKEKWIALVESFNPSQVTDQQHSSAAGEGGESTALTQEQVDQNMEQLYEALSEYAEQSGLGDKMTISRGAGYIFITFDDTVFFDGDSYVLRDDGKIVLDNIASTLAQASDSINEILALGHTAQASPDQVNDVDKDRFLASNRATVVTIYLQEKNIIDPARLVSVGYGQWRPVASNDTSADRAQNRRVELIISGVDVENETSDSITQYYDMRGDMSTQNGSSGVAVGILDGSAPSAQASTGGQETSAAPSAGTAEGTSASAAAEIPAQS